MLTELHAKMVKQLGLQPRDVRLSILGHQTRVRYRRRYVQALPSPDARGRGARVEWFGSVSIGGPAARPDRLSTTDSLKRQVIIVGFNNLRFMRGFILIEDLVRLICVFQNAFVVTE